MVETVHTVQCCLMWACLFMLGVSLVETARFTAEEAASLGLTNVTTQVEE